jgi:peptidoglycan LD-endopeptidase LytH
VFPVAGLTSYGHTHHDYPATDIMAACGSTVRAATDGVVLEVNRVDRYDPTVNDGATRGGLFVSLLGNDGVRYYGSHLRAVAAGLGAGVRVTAGQKIGEVGRSGDASACHLHFGVSPPCARTGDWWVRRGVIWPWSYLDSWRRGGTSSPVATVTAWQGSHGCPASVGAL